MALMCECCTVVPRANDSYCDDCYELVNRAVQAVINARRDGILGQGYDPSSWRSLQSNDRLDHAATHIYMHRRQDTSEDHLAHAICDLVMLYEI